MTQQKEPKCGSSVRSLLFKLTRVRLGEHESGVKVEMDIRRVEKPGERYISNGLIYREKERLQSY